MRRVHVHFLPALVQPTALTGAAVAVIDVLRATTTIAHALDAGAADVIPCLEVDEARERAATLPPGTYLLGGERGGLPIDGFDLGNSPSEFTRQVVEGKTIVFTTTNGTRAVERCRAAQRIVLAAFANLTAVADALQREANVDLLCAGTRGEITAEDVLLAGAIVDRLTGASQHRHETNDQARIARDAWRAAGGRDLSSDAVALSAVLQESRGGRNLVRLGLARDIRAAAEADCTPLVPQLDLATWRITR